MKLISKCQFKVKTIYYHVYKKLQKIIKLNLKSIIRNSQFNLISWFGIWMCKPLTVQRNEHPRRETESGQGRQYIVGVGSDNFPASLLAPEGGDPLFAQCR